jgi:hypothetical protein
VKNRKTTIGGILAAIGLGLQTATNPIIQTIGICAAAIGTLLTGTAAADAKKHG